MSKRINIITTIRYPAGGTRTYLKYTYGCLDKDKYHFIFLTVNVGEIDQLRQDLCEVSSEIFEVNRFGFPFFSRLFSLLLDNKVQLIHSQGYACGMLSSIVNVFFRIPHIITFHGTLDSTTLKGSFVSLKKYVMQFLLTRADFLNVVSEDAKANLIEYFPGMKKYLPKIVVIENGIDVNFFRENAPLPKRLSEIEGISQDTFVVGYLGRYMPEKGFPVLIDAIELIAQSPESTNRNLKVLALGWDSYIREYQALITEKKIERYFVFIDFQRDVRWILRQINLLVIPSLREAFGLVAIEGLISGTPIVASDCVGLREVLRNTPAILVKAGDPRALASAIIEKRVSSGKEAALQFIPEVVKRFDVKVTAAKLDSLFEMALNKRPTRGL